MTAWILNILRAVAEIMKLPVEAMLVVFLTVAVFSVGWLITEFFTEHRHMKASLPKMVEELRAGAAASEKLMKDSALLRRQKQALLVLLAHPEYPADLKQSLAANLLEKEQAHYDGMIKITDLVSKLAPMFGLLGTLIPLGPGIIALGQGDTYTLSVSLLTAFDTTIAGLCAAALCLVVSTIRKRWYAAYLNDLETLMDCVRAGDMK